MGKTDSNNTVFPHGKETTVKDLMDALSKMDPKAIVVGQADNFELNHAWITASMVTEYNAKKVNKPFRDAFDGGNYTKDVYDIGEGKTKVVKISF